MTPEFILSLVMAAGTPVALYAAIRADLARLQERSEYHAREIEFLRERAMK